MGRKGQGRNGWRGWRRSNAGEEKTNKEKKRKRETNRERETEKDGLKMATKSLNVVTKTSAAFYVPIQSVLVFFFCVCVCG